MPRPTIVDVQNAFTGLNTTADPAHLGPSEVSKCTNGKFTINGGLTARLGSRRVLSGTGSVGAGVQNLMVWPNGPNTPELLVVAGSQLYAGHMQGPPPWSLSYEGACSSWPSPGMAAFTNAAGLQCVYIGASTGLFVWDNASLTQLTSTPSLQQLCVQNQRLFGINAPGGNVTYPFNLYWSSLNSGDDCGIPSTPDAGGNAVIITFGESFPTDLLAYGPGLVIAHVAGLSTFTGWSQSDIAIQSGTQGLSADTGVAGMQSMCAVENFAVVASDRGCYVVTPYGYLEEISKPIDATWPDIVAVYNGFAFGNPGTTMVHDKINHSIYLVANDRQSVYVYNYRTQGWAGPWSYNWASSGSQATITSLAAGYDALGNYYVLAGCSDGCVRQMEVEGLGFDDVAANGTGGAQYTMKAVTRPLVGADQSGAPTWDQEKAWRYVDVQAQLTNPSGAQVSVRTYPAEGLATTAIDRPLAYNNQPDTTPRTYRVQAGGRGQAVVVEIRDTPMTNPNGQNVFTGVRATGFSYGRRFGLSPLPLLLLPHARAVNGFLLVLLVVSAAACLHALRIRRLPRRSAGAITRFAVTLPVAAARPCVLWRHLVALFAVRRPLP